MPGRKVPAGLATLTGVRLTPGALTQDALRRAAGAGGTTDEPWRAAVPAAAVVYPADTGGRVGGEPASLMALETDAATVYQSRSRHRHEAVPEVIPADDGGVMVTERGRRDDAQAFEEVRQHTCLAHVQRSLSAGLATTTGRARDFGEGLKELWQEARPRWPDDRDGPVTDFRTEAKAVQEDLTYQLRDRRLQDPDHQRRLNERGWHHDRGHLVRCLDDPRIEPTNQRAERALRPAVITRKVSPCAKNASGAHAFAAFTSVVRTLAKNSTASLVEGLYHLFRSPNPQAFSP
jgi:transposase